MVTPSATLDDARRFGRELRNGCARREHGRWDAPGRDPVAILESQHPARLADLIAVRIGRMLQSPFAFYRGAAAVMANDLAGESRTGHHIVICGDAHVSNFGLFASPERRVLFDLNDFDEASTGPWEWDVKRLAASVVLAARSVGASNEQATDATTRAIGRYRETMLTLAEMPALERYYFHLDTQRLEAIASDVDRKTVERTVRRATRRTSERLLSRITTTTADGAHRIIDEPPITRHVEHATVSEFAELWHAYRSTVRSDIAVLLSQFRFVDYVLRIVGVGSVGTRCYLLLFAGPADEALFLQVKEAAPSVIQAYGRIAPSTPPGVTIDAAGQHGHRVIVGQRILQAQSDPFLGWTAGFAGETAERRPVDYYWRQFRDMKGSVELDRLEPSQVASYAELCGAVLARAHSQSPHPGVLAGYLGRSDTFDRAVTDWATRYADQTERDFTLVEQAVARGRLPAERSA